MRKTLVLLCVLGLMASMPAAFAQEGRRDPFDPLVDEDAGVIVVPAGTGTDTSTGGDTGTSTGSGTTEGTPNTGMATANWTGLAYLLIVMGAAAVALARLGRPITSVHPRRR